MILYFIIILSYYIIILYNTILLYYNTITLYYETMIIIYYNASKVLVAKKCKPIEIYRCVLTSMF